MDQAKKKKDTAEVKARHFTFETWMNTLGGGWIRLRDMEGSFRSETPPDPSAERVDDEQARDCHLFSAYVSGTFSSTGRKDVRG